MVTAPATSTVCHGGMPNITEQILVSARVTIPIPMELKITPR